MATEQEYKERHRYWSTIAINQLSFTNNFLLTISTGMLAFCFEKFDKRYSNIHCCLCNKCAINGALTWSVLSLICLLVAIIFGIIVMISRLYDNRITRHITWVRLKAFRQNKRKLSDKRNEELNCCKKAILFLRILFCGIKLNKDQVIDSDFDEDRKIAFNLGQISWSFIRLQAIAFLFASILYILSLLLK